ncbi:MAG: DNA recombination protein RmuC [Candidatus Geothermincolales bacterium]
MGSEVAAIIIGLIVGVALGITFGWLASRRGERDKLVEKERELSEHRMEIARLSQALALKEAEVSKLSEEAEEYRELSRKLEIELASLRSRIDSEKKALEEKLELLENAKARLAETFSALSRDALQQNSKIFFDTAREALEKYMEGARRVVEDRSKEIDGVVSPLRESLERVQKLMREMETERKHEMGRLSEQLRSLASAQQELQQEAGKLVTALKTLPSARGRWGEIQLRRVAELAGMVEHCDFQEQVSTSSEEGRMRPDMIVHLPGGKHIVVDAKAPVNAYLESLETTDETERERKLGEHAKNIRTRVTELGSRKYWEHWSSPDFAVLFLPGENFFSAALEKDPGLIEYAAEHRVILATPTTMIALLRAVAYGWRQEAIAKNAESIREIGLELHKRLQKLVDHFLRMREGLKQAVEAFNDAMGSFESRVLVQARRFEEMGLRTDKEIKSVEAIDRSIRTLRSTE